MKRSFGTKRTESTRVVLAATLAVVCVASPHVFCAEAPSEFLERADGHHVQGRIAGSLASGFSFIPTDGSPTLALGAGSIVRFEKTARDSLAGPPLFRVHCGEVLRVSGSIRAISPTAVRVGASWQGPEISLLRPGVQVVLQRPGVARVLVDDFESLEPSRWTKSGKLSLVDDLHVSEHKSLRIPSSGASISQNLDEPLFSGRLELAFHDDGLIATGRKWSIDFTFQGQTGPWVLRVIPGWTDESLAVEMPIFPALPVQRLARTPGWHRFMLRFGPEKTEISVDGKDLAHGKGPDGPLISIRLGSLPPAADAPVPEVTKVPVCHIDDLQLIRFAEPTANFELDVKQDEVRLVVGDQLFGRIQTADSERVSMTVEGKAISLPWGQISGLYFRRLAASGVPVEGLLVRVEWAASSGAEPETLDFAEGAMTAVTDRTITVATPYSGTLALPRELLRTVQISGYGRRYLIDATAHHLGDEFSNSAPVLDPPEPEGGVLERSIDLADVPGGSWFLVLDVVQVVGEEGDENFSQHVKDGELRTYALVNGKRIDYVNRHIKDKNETPARVRMAVPGGLLHPGRNTIRLELVGMADKPSQLDDLGVLQIGLEQIKAADAKRNGAQP